MGPFLRCDNYIVNTKVSNIFHALLVTKYRNIVPIETHFKGVLKAWGKVPGDDIVLMVMNEGEMDLLVNFACSCRTHNISMSHMMVVAASESILPMIRATGYELQCLHI